VYEIQVGVWEGVHVVLQSENGIIGTAASFTVAADCRDMAV
jgi:hypothetical protein